MAPLISVAFQIVKLNSSVPEGRKRAKTTILPRRCRSRLLPREAPMRLLLRCPEPVGRCSGRSGRHYHRTESRFDHLADKSSQAAVPSSAALILLTVMNSTA